MLNGKQSVPLRLAFSPFKWRLHRVKRSKWFGTKTSKYTYLYLYIKQYYSKYTFLCMEKVNIHICTCSKLNLNIYVCIK